VSCEMYRGSEFAAIEGAKVFTARLCECGKHGCIDVAGSTLATFGAEEISSDDLLKLTKYMADLCNVAFSMGKRQVYADISRRKKQNQEPLVSVGPGREFSVDLRVCTSCGQPFTIPSSLGSTECPACRGLSGDRIDVVA
jgi:hypothetical protein